MTDTATDDPLILARQHLARSRPEAALRLTETVLGQGGDTREALYVAAVAARYAGAAERAAGYLDRLIAHSPEYGRAYQEQGHLARDKGDADAAILAYARACRLNPALEASWKWRAELLAARGRQGEAATAKAQADRLAAMPRELVAVTNMIHEGRLLKAEALCRRFLQANPRHVEGMRLLADIGSRMGILDDADFLLESAVALDPDNIQLRFDWIQVLRKRQKFAQALEQAEALYDREPENPLFQSQLAIEAMQTGDYNRAFALFDAVLEKLPGDVATLTSKGHALKTRGDAEGAVGAYRAATAARPDHGDAWYSLANLKTYRFTDSEIARMHEQAGRGDLAFMDRVNISFALGKAHEDRKEYEESFRFYDQGNALKRQQSRYDADQMTAELALQREHCTRELFEAKAGSGDPAPDPIFVLGLPRAGSTLIEQILASHSQVDGTLELPNILSLAHRLRGRARKAGEGAYPANLSELTREQFAAMGRDFIENTRVHRQGAPFFIDKMPNNFRHIGLIHLILPNAKIIDARRDPMDCCFSGFKQLFAEGQEFTYGLHQIGRYYRDYVDLMAHWDAVLPGKVLRVRHEDVIDDLEGQVRRMLDHLGLPFEPACLQFHKTDRAVRTASSEQVRRPINRSGVGVWRNYEPWLDELKDALGPDLAP
ncbi:sulfotransferase [Stakelama sp. CBK3Z-3]|uniref:Sulfotransferase n=1 Tax=Stakelama flava TaxID=2860338 RepID=A0ABS6XMI7_9SPHN|nr:tetratricopeptide repeat-containing sulfotransferase family protein [Stakelama flava]MBW4330660.1 sulfotransferase [Stakelama flava]